MKRKEESQYISSGVLIGASTITGYFISVDVPEVPVGEDIKATIDFYAINPGALYWSTFLIADSPGLGLTKLLDKARELGQEGGRIKTYNLGKMPDKSIAISFFIFAHDDAGYDWDWSEYLTWMNGYPIEITYLNSAYRFLSPGEPPPPPPEEVVFSGVITRVEPTEFTYGEPIDLSIDFKAYCESLYYQIRGWETVFEAKLNGLIDSDAQSHYGRNGSRTGGTLHFGVATKNLTGTLTLWGRGLALPPAIWKKLHEIDLTIRVTGVPEPPPNGEEPEPPPTLCTIDADCPEGYVCVDGVCVKEKKFPWLPAALIGGGAIIAIAAISKPKK